MAVRSTPSLPKSAARNRCCTKISAPPMKVICPTRTATRRSGSAIRARSHSSRRNRRRSVTRFSAMPPISPTTTTTINNMPSLDELLEEARIAHGHLCAGQVLGVRMAMLGLRELGIHDPRGRDRKRIVTYVEIDRCATDAIGVVTGCRLGKRALKFRDWGKMAATFVDLESGRAIRIAAKESSKALAREMYPEIENKNQQQMRAYREMNDNHLFDEHWVRVT